MLRTRPEAVLCFPGEATKTHLLAPSKPDGKEEDGMCSEDNTWHIRQPVSIALLLSALLSFIELK